MINFYLFWNLSWNGVQSFWAVILPSKQILPWKVFKSISDAIAFVTKPNKVPLWRQSSLRLCCFYFLSSSLNAEFPFSLAKLLKNEDLVYRSFRPRERPPLSAICQLNPENTIVRIHTGYRSFNLTSWVTKTKFLLIIFIQYQCKSFSDRYFGFLWRWSEQ